MPLHPPFDPGAAPVVPDSFTLDQDRRPRLRLNLRGAYTLIRHETQRFFSVGLQTVLAPTVSSLLFFGLFSFVIGRIVIIDGQGGYGSFLACGLIMMATLQNAFANTSSSLMISKIQGNLVDVMMPPLFASEWIIGFVGGGIARGLVVAFASWLVLLPWTGLLPQAPVMTLLILINASFFTAQLGLLAGLWARKFDQMAGLNSFVITPLTMLSGTFYTTDRLPDFLRFLCLFDPFYYSIDGLRAAVLGVSEVPFWHANAVLLLFNGALLCLVFALLRCGYRLRS